MISVKSVEGKCGQVAGRPVDDLGEECGRPMDGFGEKCGRRVWKGNVHGAADDLGEECGREVWKESVEDETVGTIDGAGCAARRSELA
jgi:hypothetical protein